MRAFYQKYAHFIGNWNWKLEIGNLMEMCAFSRKQRKCNKMQIICIKCNKTDVPFTLKNLKGTVWRLSHNIWKRDY